MQHIPMALKGNTDIALLGLLCMPSQGALQQHSTLADAFVVGRHRLCSRTRRCAHDYAACCSGGGLPRQSWRTVHGNRRQLLRQGATWGHSHAAGAALGAPGCRPGRENAEFAAPWHAEVAACRHPESVAALKAFVPQQDRCYASLKGLDSAIQMQDTVHHRH